MKARLILAALALAVPANAPAAVVPAAAPATELDQLVELMLPSETMVQVIDQASRQELGKRAEFVRNPGMADFVIERLRPEIEKMMGSAISELRADVARILAEDLTTAEIGELYAFFSSPTGRRLQALMIQTVAENPMLDNGEQQRIGMEKFNASLGPADYDTIRMFGTSSAAEKLTRTTPRINAATSAWSERLLAKEGPRFDVLRAQAIADFKRQHPETAK